MNSSLATPKASRLKSQNLSGQKTPNCCSSNFNLLKNGMQSALWNGQQQVLEIVTMPPHSSSKTARFVALSTHFPGMRSNRVLQKPMPCAAPLICLTIPLRRWTAFLPPLRKTRSSSSIFLWHPAPKTSALVPNLSRTQKPLRALKTTRPFALMREKPTQHLAFTNTLALPFRRAATRPN